MDLATITCAPDSVVGGGIIAWWGAQNTAALLGAGAVLPNSVGEELSIHEPVVRCEAVRREIVAQVAPKRVNKSMRGAAGCPSHTTKKERVKAPLLSRAYT